MDSKDFKRMKQQADKVQKALDQLKKMFKERNSRPRVEKDILREK